MLRYALCGARYYWFVVPVSQYEVCTVWRQVLLVCSTGEPVLGIWAVDCSPSSFGFADCTLSSFGFVEGHTNVL